MFKLIIKIMKGNEKLMKKVNERKGKIEKGNGRDGEKIGKKKKKKVFEKELRKRKRIGGEGIGEKDV